MLFSYWESLLDRELKACANETKHVNKDLPIYILNSFIFVNHHIGSWWTIRATDNVIFSVFSQLQSLSLPSHWMTQFFQAHVAIDLQSYEEGLERYSNLSQAGFSENKYILLQTALAQYHARGVVLSIYYTITEFVPTLAILCPRPRKLLEIFCLPFLWKLRIVKGT